MALSDTRARIRDILARTAPDTRAFSDAEIDAAIAAATPRPADDWDHRFAERLANIVARRLRGDVF